VALSNLKGGAHAWAALRASSAESRFDAQHATGLTTLVAREEECELLLRRWAKAKSKGKSRAYCRNATDSGLCSACRIRSSRYEPGKSHALCVRRSVDKRI
jgi:hypothetical protein